MFQPLVHTLVRFGTEKRDRGPAISAFFAAENPVWRLPAGPLLCPMSHLSLVVIGPLVVKRQYAELPLAVGVSLAGACELNSPSR